MERSDGGKAVAFWVTSETLSLPRNQHGKQVKKAVGEADERTFQTGTVSTKEVESGAESRADKQEPTVLRN